MTTRSWRRKLFSRKDRPLAAEALEDRLDPAVFNVAAADGARLIPAGKAVNDETAHPGPDTINLTHSTNNFTTPDNYWYGPDALPAVCSANTIEGNGGGGIVIRDGGTVTSGPFRIIISKSVCLSVSRGICSLCSITMTHPPRRGGTVAVPVTPPLVPVPEPSHQGRVPPALRLPAWAVPAGLLTRFMMQ